MSSLSIVFAGTPEFGLPSLQAIDSSHHRLIAVYSQPDRPAGRGRKLQASAIKSWAVEHHYPVYQPVHFKNPETVEQLSALKPDLMVVIAYGLILPRSVLAIPRLGCINVHASLLPRWRGASPIQQALLAGDKETGVTIMQMDAGMDTGDELALVRCPITEKETAGSLHDKLAQLAVSPLVHTLDLLASEQVRASPQDATKATYAAKIDKEKALISWQQPAQVIERQIRAYNPWPICFTHSSAGELIKIYQAEVEPVEHQSTPGTVLAINKTGMLVATREQALKIQRLQFAGGKPVSIAEWMNAGRYSSFIGQVFE